MNKRISDIVAETLVELGIKDCFTLVGGGAMHLNDAFGNNAGIKCTYFLHEQAAAIAAEGYARVDGNMPVVCVTTGPGGTNALTGVLCAWLDSIPMIVVSGQVKTTSSVSSTGLQLRQFGEQEYNIVESVKPMTKYAVMVTDKKEVKYHIQKAVYLAKSGRKGPCWVDIPLDIQGAKVDEDDLISFTPETDERQIAYPEVLEQLKQAKKPVVLIGSAIRSSGAYNEFRRFCKDKAVPFIVAKSIADLMSDEDENYYGNFGINGGRAGNFIVQNADCILALGCRMSLGQIGFNYKAFSPNSVKIVVDADKEELKKSTLKIDYPINEDLNSFFKWLNSEDIAFNCDSRWIDYCNRLKEKYPIYQPKYADREKVNAYYFAETIKKYLPDDAICISGNSCSAVSIKQCGIAHNGQRLWGNVNCGTMGYDIPASIGAAIAAGRQIVCFAGDGSFQLNIQELQTIVSYQLPVKFFVFNNNGYRSIVLSQGKNFGRLSGCTQGTGLSLPDIGKLAAAYGIPYFKCERTDGLTHTLDKVFNCEGYAICEIMEDPDQEIEPKLGNRILDDGTIVSPSISDLYPFLERDEYEIYADFDKFVTTL